MREAEEPGSGRGKGGTGTRNVKQEVIYCDNTHTQCSSKKVECFHISSCTYVCPSPGVEVHILNATNVIDLVHIHTLGRCGEGDRN